MKYPITYIAFELSQANETAETEMMRLQRLQEAFYNGLREAKIFDKIDLDVDKLIAKKKLDVSRLTIRAPDLGVKINDAPKPVFR